MAGTLVADVLQDGAGNSTAMDNAIYGSAKAWVTVNVSTGTLAVTKSYNVSSVTTRGTGQYTVNFTSSLPDANYAMASSAGTGPTYANSGGIFTSYNIGPTGGTYPTTSSCQVNTVRGTYNGSDGVYISPYLAAFVFFD